MSKNPRQGRGKGRAPDKAARQLTIKDADFFRYLAGLDTDLEGLLAERRFLTNLVEASKIDRVPGLLGGAWRAVLLNSFLIAIAKSETAQDVKMKAKALMRHAELYVPDIAGDIFTFALTEDALHLGPERMGSLPPIRFPRRQKR